MKCKQNRKPDRGRKSRNTREEKAGENKKGKLKSEGNCRLRKTE